MFGPRRFLAVLLLVSPAAFAQPAPDAGPPPPNGAPQAVPAGRMSPRAKFDAANITHDGRLTLDQAQAAGMRGVAQHFNEIDADHKGYVTLQDIRAWRQARRGARPVPPP